MSERRKRRVFRRTFHLERWRVIAEWRYFHGFGAPKFEFVFRFGRPKPVKLPAEIVYEDDFADEPGSSP